MKATYCKGHTRVHSSLIKIRLGTGDSSVNRYPQPHEWLISSNFQDLSTGRCEVLGAKRRRTAIVLHCCPTGSNNNNGAGTVGRCHSSTKVSWLESKEQPRKVAVEDKVGHADGKYENMGHFSGKKHTTCHNTHCKYLSFSKIHILSHTVVSFNFETLPLFSRLMQH